MWKVITTLSTFFAFSISIESKWLAPNTFSTCNMYISIGDSCNHLYHYNCNARKQNQDYWCTSLTKVSVSRISMSPSIFLLIPFCDGGKLCLDWFLTIPLPLPPAKEPPRDIEFLNPRPDPERPPLWAIPGSSPSHRKSLGEI